MGQTQSRLGSNASSSNNGEVTEKILASADIDVETQVTTPGKDSWYYPVDIENDLQDVDLPPDVKAEVLNTTWEYVRCSAPQYTNWERYVAFMRTITICSIAEFKGKLVDVSASDNIMGYDVGATLATLFKGTPGHADMAQTWLESIVPFSCSQPTNPAPGVMFEILSEIYITLYDAVAFFKHRSEGETHNTFAYMPEHLRVKAYQQSRQILWALDTAWAHHHGRQIAINFIRLTSGPTHIMMRRYRFVEENLTIGKRETDEVIGHARTNAKLWNRIDGTNRGVNDTQRYKDLLAQSDDLMFPELAGFLESGGDGSCKDCRYRASYGAETPHEFGGVKLCGGCKETWQEYMESLPERAKKVFPEIASVEARRIHRPQN
ncbi:hypothetical protein V501_04439 [Pseudogymnoascus sp. VKM F-4519 (FW-2642)]|nr:hypothetical protein V501_04439 [Pseudogymnoascus sp. VKM F-4519 (FW-2642)]